MDRLKVFLLLISKIFGFAQFAYCYICQTSGHVSIECQYGCCGDENDQSCCSAPYWDWYRIVGVVTGGIVVAAFIIMAVVFLCACCNKRQSRISHGVTTVMPVHPPPQPIQPPAYNSVMKNRHGIGFASTNTANGLPPPYSYENPTFGRNNSTNT